MWYHYIVIGGIGLMLMGFLWKWLQRNKIKRMQATIKQTILDVSDDAEVAFLSDDIMGVSIGDYVAFVKIIIINPEHELILASKSKWVINKKPSEWKKSSTPDFIPRVEAFQNMSHAEDVDDSIVLVYPRAKIMRYYRNESNVNIFTSKDTVHGSLFLSWSDFREYLKTK